MTLANNSIRKLGDHSVSLLQNMPRRERLLTAFVCSISAGIPISQAQQQLAVAHPDLTKQHDIHCLHKRSRSRSSAYLEFAAAPEWSPGRLIVPFRDTEQGYVCSIESLSPCVRPDRTHERPIVLTPRVRSFRFVLVQAVRACPCLWQRSRLPLSRNMFANGIRQPG